jgi:hypothetical protein
MNVNIERHKLLKILSEHFIDIELGVSEDNILGIDFKKLYILLKCDYKKLKIISSELYTYDEIGFYDNKELNTVGLYIKPNGITAYSNKKYKNIFYSRVKNILKDFVQIVIPILSLIVAYFAIQLKISEVNNYNQKQIDTLQKEIKILKSNKPKSQTQIQKYQKK